MTQTAPVLFGSNDRPRLVSVVFDAEAVDIEGITPYADAPADVQLEILSVRRTVTALMSARDEMDALIDIHEADAEEAEAKVEIDDERLTPTQRKRASAQARRSRTLAERCRMQKRQNELEIMAYMASKEG